MTPHSFPYPINLYTNFVDNHAAETVLEVALAGFTKNEIKVKVEDNMLSVVLEKETSEKSNSYESKFHTRGIAKRNASISYTLSQTADANNIKVLFILIRVPYHLEQFQKMKSFSD